MKLDNIDMWIFESLFFHHEKIISIREFIDLLKLEEKDFYTSDDDIKQRISTLITDDLIYSEVNNNIQLIGLNNENIKKAILQDKVTVKEMLADSFVIIREYSNVLNTVNVEVDVMTDKFTESLEFSKEVSKEITEDLIGVKDDLKNTIKTHRNSIDNMINERTVAFEKLSKDMDKSATRIVEIAKESDNLKSKIIEILGIFIAIFTLISVNVTTLSQLSNKIQILDRISIILTINGSICFVVIVLLACIRIFIYNIQIRNFLKIALCMIFSFFIIALGIFIALYN